MKPIAQTFLVFQPNTGIDGVFLSKIDIFFKAVSSTYGISLQIRTVENGFPTSNIVAGGQAYLPATLTVASDDSTIATTFNFYTMPFLQTNTQYAIVLIPDGGNDQYLVWTAQLGDTDVSTNAPIYTNNQLGNLFISSNDLVFTPVITESMKYNLYVADFFKGNTSISSATANVVYKILPTDFIKMADTVSTFQVGEAVYASNSKITSVATYSNNLVTVPNSTVSDFAVNNFIYVSKLDRSQFNLVRVTAAPNSTTITVSGNISFTNASCVAGKVQGNGALYGVCQSIVSAFAADQPQLVLDSTLANTSLNFAGLKGQFLFGSSSGASANIYSIHDKAYDSITPSLNYIVPTQTNTSVTFAGYSNTLVQDSPNGLLANLPYEFVDQERLLLSRSNALANGSIGANDSLTVAVSLTTSNNLTAPYVDALGTSVTITRNILPSNTQLSGCYITLSNTNGSFVTNELVTQAGAVAVVAASNSSYLVLNTITGTFAANTTTIVGGTSSANATVSGVTPFNENLGNGYYAASRYICKNVILAEGQDAEDLLLYMSAYRPPGANFNVYGKFLHGSDSDAFSKKSWSQLVESPLTYALFSSPVNRSDVVELQYDLPLSVTVDVSGGITTNTTITVADTSKYSNGSFIYLADNTNNKFNVRQINGISNSTTMSLSTNTTISSTNVTVGYIPMIQTQTDAFLYDRNSNISRYVNSSDIVFDTFKTFAVKVVPVSNNGITVPIMNNIRCVALQV